MNYGKEKASKKQSDISSKSKMQKKKAGVRFFKGLLVCCIILAIVGAAGAGLFFKKILKDTPQISPTDVKPSGYSTTVYTQDGMELERFISSGSNRIYKSMPEIPVDLQHAFVAIEDERFYQHNGIDLQGIARAAVVGLTRGNFSEGASTITQQLIKNNVFPNFTKEKTFYDRVERKLQEQFLAVEIEKQMPKDEILEAYMNTINLGQNTLGVQSASRRYFNKDVSELTLSEASVIAGITQNPGLYNPVTNPQDNAERRKKVLGDMMKQKYITKEAYDAALADPVYERIQSTNVEAEVDSPYSYFIDELSKNVIEDLKTKKNYTDAQAYNAVYSGGLSIYATQDQGMQQICNEEFDNPDNYPALTEVGVDYRLTITRGNGSVENYSTEMFADYIRNARGEEYPLIFSDNDQAVAAVEEFKSTLGIQEGDTIVEKLGLSLQPQASVVIMDQKTGYVKAMVGGRGAKDGSLSLNRATDTYRQPGSCFKILSTYAPAIDAAGRTLATVLKDEPFNYDNGKPVKNWYPGYKGNVTIRKAIEQSMNIIAVKTLTEITPQLGFNYLKNFGFTTLEDGTNPDKPGFSDIQQATALGGITNGVENIEMTAAYAAIANNGTYIKPVLYTKILDHDGNVLLDNTPETHPVIQETTAALLTNAMIDVVTKGTGTKAKLSNMPVSGKTGTTSDNKDIWFSAYTPYLTCSVWGGYDTNKDLNEHDTSWHLVLWHNIMERIHAGLPTVEFTLPPTIEQKSICPTSGLLAVADVCPAYTEVFAAGTAPTQTCTTHVGSYKKKDEEKPNEAAPAPAPAPTPEAPAPAPAPAPTPTPEPTPPPTPTP